MIPTPWRPLLVLLAVLSVVRAAEPSAATPYASRWVQDENDPALRTFRLWTESSPAVDDPSARERWRAEGLELARARRAVLADLIVADPASALAHAVPATVRRGLPPEVVAQLEQRISGTGTLEVLIVETDSAPDHGHRISRLATIAGEIFQAYVYGRRLEQATKEGIPLHGIGLNGHLALHASPARLLEPDDVTAAAGLTLEIAGQVRRFSDQQSLSTALTRLESAEAGIQPRPPAVRWEEHPDGTSTVAPLVSPAGSSHSLGAKKMLIIPVDFSDLPGQPTTNDKKTTYTKDYCQALADNELAPFYAKSSYGNTSLTSTVTPLLRLPRAAAYYATAQNAGGVFIGDTDIRTDTLSAATAAGFDPAGYDRVMLLHSGFHSLPSTQVSYGGLGQFGGSFLWVNAALDFRVTAHELGHTYGLNHANLWKVTDGNPVSPAGSSVEYKDYYDVMGSGGNDPRLDFNPWYKSLLGWMSAAQVQTATTSGTYRIYAYDHANSVAAASELVALKIPKDAGTDYWISLRRNLTDNALLSHGAYIIWGYAGAAGRSNLLNLTTPGGDHTDAPLAVGRGFSDPAGNITLRVTGEGGTAPNYYLDVEVTLGASAPTFFSPPANTSTPVFAGSSVSLKTNSAGNPLPVFKWQRQAAGQGNWVDLDEAGFYSGTRTSALTLRSATTALRDDQFRCLATNSAGFATSPAFTLAVTDMLWETYSGAAGVRSSTNGTLAAARYAEPNFLTRDATGNVYLTTVGNRTVRKITTDGLVSKVAGTDGVSGSADGIGGAAQFYAPAGIAVDAAGNLYVADGGIHSIRRVTPTGAVTTIAGLSGTSGAVDGTGSAARFNSPQGLVIDAAENLYIADRSNHVIRKISPQGAVTVFAGRFGASGSTNGAATTARFNLPAGLAIDRTGNLYVGDSGNRLIRKITPDGTVSTAAGTAGQSGTTDGAANAAKFGSQLYGVAWDPDGSLYIGDTENHLVRKISPTGAVSSLGGLGGTAGATDGPTGETRFNQPRGLIPDGNGGLLVADYGNSTLRRLLVATTQPAPPTLARVLGPRYHSAGDEVRLEVNAGGYPAPTLQWQRSRDAGVTWQNVANDNLHLGATAARLTLGAATPEMSGYQFRCLATNVSGTTQIQPIVLRVYTVTTLAGTAGAAGAADGLTGAARFRDPRGLTLDSAGNLYVADRGNHIIRRISPAGQVTTIAGLAGTSGSANGPAQTARFNLPNSVAVARDGALFVTDASHTVRRIAPDGTVSLFAGGTNSAGFADGPATAARFNSPAGLALDASGNLWVSDSLNQVMRRISPAGIVSTVAGLPRTSGYVTVDGTGQEARFRSPLGISLAPDDALWVADASNHRVRRVTAAGVTTTLAGTSNWGSNDGNGSGAWFDTPNAVTVDLTGEGYVADTNNNLVRLVTPAGDVTAIAGSDVAAASTDGAGRAARFSGPKGIAITDDGTIYVADSGNHTIRRFGSAGGVSFTMAPPTIAASPAPRTVAPGTATTLLVFVASTATPAYQWYRNGVPLNGATDVALSINGFSAADAGLYSVSATTAFGTVWSNPAGLSSTASANPGRLINLSLLTALSSPDENVTFGTVIGGSGTSGSKPVLFRAAGPALAAFGVADTLDNPRLELFLGSGKIGENDDWGGGATLADAFTRVGAFPYGAPGSKDAALYVPAITAGSYSMRISGVNGTTGSVIAELYDATPNEQYRVTTTRLINVSVLKEIGAGFTMGFVIGGETSRSVLIRAVGPGLAAVGVTSGYVTDPRLTLYGGPKEIGRNDDWGGGSALAAAASSVGAFPIPPTSRDAVLLSTVPPGAYTVQIGAPTGAAGLVLVEVYEVP